MEDASFDKSPAMPPAIAGERPKWQRRLVFSGLLVSVGSFFLLLLNGQVFTNTLVFLGLCTLSGLLWIPLLIPSARKQDRRFACYVMLGHAVVIIVFAIGLPEKYKWQKDFNARIERLPKRDDSPTQYSLEHVFRNGQQLQGQVCVERLHMSPRRGVQTTSVTTTTEIRVGTRGDGGPGKSDVTVTWEAVRVRTVDPQPYWPPAITDFDAAAAEDPTSLYSLLLRREFVFRNEGNRRFALLSGLDEYLATIKHVDIADKRDRWRDAIELWLYEPNAYLPTTPVAVGQTWTVRRNLSTVPMGYPLLHSLSPANLTVSAELARMERSGKDHVAVVKLAGRVEQSYRVFDLTGTVRLHVEPRILESQEIELTDRQASPAKKDTTSRIISRLRAVGETQIETRRP